MILITGATGTVGSEVVKRLSAQGMQVRAVTPALRKAEASPVPHVEFVKGDFDDPDSMRRACAGMERAFLLSNSTERAEQQQTAFVEVAKRSGVRHIVKLSQLHADVNSPGRFPRYHGAVEAAVKSRRPNLHISATEPLHAGSLEFRAEHQREERLLCRSR
jgi:uncharacterized protein YbjT (DUF2867 family)